MPIHKEIHWCLAVINKKDEKLQYLDSLGGMDSQVLKVLVCFASHVLYMFHRLMALSGMDSSISS